MLTTRLNCALGLGVLLIAALGCNMSATTANISGLKIGKDKSVSQEAASFEANDPIYGVATVSNVPGKVKVKGRLVFEDVPGFPAGQVPGAEKTLDFDGSGTATYTFTPPPGGWAKGKYKLEVILMDDNGQQKDQKAASFTVS